MGNSTPQNCVRDCERVKKEEEDGASRSRGSEGGAPGFAAKGDEGGGNAVVVQPGRVFTDPFELLQGGNAPARERVGGDPTGPMPLTPRAAKEAEQGKEDAEGASPMESPRPAEEEPPRTPRTAGGEEKPGSSYAGQWLGEKKHGNGTLIQPDGIRYEGEFQHDRKHGHGVLTWADGRQFRGGFQAGKFHGKAVMIWPDGRNYVGQYEENRKHGIGVFAWQDGRRYEGQWIEGKRHGRGIYTNAKGTTRAGQWMRDRPISWDPEDIPPEELRRGWGGSAAFQPALFQFPGDSALGIVESTF